MIYEIDQGGGIPNQSPTLGKLAAALAKAQGEIEGAAKDQENPYFKSRYADLASVWNACRQPLSKNGIAVIQTTKNNESGVIITTLLVHTSNEWISGDLWVKPMKPDPQALGSAITYGRRYALAAMVGVSPEDDDGESAMKRKLKPLGDFQREAKAAKTETELVNWWTNSEQEAMKNLSGTEYDELVKTCAEVKSRFKPPEIGSPPASNTGAKKAKSTIAEFHKHMAELKIKKGEVRYYIVLNSRDLESAADAKSKSAREGVLRALEALPDLPAQDDDDKRFVEQTEERLQNMAREGLIDCPNGDRMDRNYCNGLGKWEEKGCKEREGCPSWDDKSPTELTPEKAEQMALELAGQVGKLPHQEEAHAWGVKAESIMAQIKTANKKAFDIVSKAMDEKKAEFENVL